METQIIVVIGGLAILIVLPQSKAHNSARLLIGRFDVYRVFLP